jgi:hypothetical protein
MFNSYSKLSKKAGLLLETGCTNDMQELLFNEFFFEYYRFIQRFL